MVLAPVVYMLRLIPPALAAVVGALYLRERRMRRSLERFGAAALETLLEAIDANDAETGAHVRRVADYSLILASAADLDAHAACTVERVALFHDVGKIHGALTDLLNEVKRLTPAEHKAIMTHPRRGANVLEPLRCFYPDLPDGVLSHHERWDGTGYPRQLQGSKIPIAARIVAIADTFDAVTHSRSYSPARSLREASKVIAEGRGTQFDPDLSDLFLSPPVIDSIAKSMHSSHGPRRNSARRRHTGGTSWVPDLRFRWRIARLSRLQRGR